MYKILRCPGCLTFTYVDRYQRWKLCHSCGETINVGRAPVYLEVRDHEEAEEIVGHLERYLHSTGRTDLDETEKENLRVEYARWVRRQS
jgi:hypothetical protein